MDKAEAYEERLRREHEREKKLLDEALAGCRKALQPLLGDPSEPDSVRLRNRVHIVPLLAQLLRDVSNSADSQKVPDYNEVRSLMEYYIGQYIPENLEDIRWLVDWCEAKGYTHDNPYFAWGSNYMFYEPCVITVRYW